MTAQQMIDRSISHNEIVFGDGDDETARYLHARASETYPTWGERDGRECRLVEYVGTTDDGAEWRVHLWDLSSLLWDLDSDEGSS